MVELWALQVMMTILLMEAGVTVPLQVLEVATLDELEPSERISTG